MGLLASCSRFWTLVVHATSFPGSLIFPPSRRLDVRAGFHARHFASSLIVLNFILYHIYMLKRNQETVFLQIWQNAET